MRRTHVSSPHPDPTGAPHQGTSDDAQQRVRPARGGGVALLAVALAGALAMPAAAAVRPGVAEPDSEPAAQVEWGECPADVADEAAPYVRPVPRFPCRWTTPTPTASR
jgi:hypothetical protein